MDCNLFGNVVTVLLVQVPYRGNMVGSGLYAVLLTPFFLGVESFPHVDSSLGIAGGDAVNITEVPFMARYFTIHNHRDICGAAIVHEKFVITSAICYYALNSLRWSSYVSVGSDQEDVGSGPLTAYLVDVVYPHPNFVLSERLDYNIAVIKLDKSLRFNERVKPIGLVKKDFVISEGAVFDTLGFGVLNTHDFKRPKQLQKVSLPYITSEKCEQLNIPVTERMICAAAEGKGTCYADDGGPLIYKGKLLGVVTLNIGCGQKDIPSVYTSIPVVRDFIDNIMKTKV